jgi:hypothetical protein
MFFVGDASVKQISKYSESNFDCFIDDIAEAVVKAVVVIGAKVGIFWIKEINLF